jgi:hypothetical protein
MELGMVDFAFSKVGRNGVQRGFNMMRVVGQVCSVGRLDLSFVGFTQRFGFGCSRPLP